MHMRCLVVFPVLPSVAFCVKVWPCWLLLRVQAALLVVPCLLRAPSPRIRRLTPLSDWWTVVPQWTGPKTAYFCNNPCTCIGFWYRWMLGNNFRLTHRHDKLYRRSDGRFLSGLYRLYDCDWLGVCWPFDVLLFYLLLFGRCCTTR